LAKLEFIKFEKGYWQEDRFFIKSTLSS